MARLKDFSLKNINLNPFSKDNKSVIYDPIGNVNARWIALKDNSDLLEAYNTVPELNAMINYMAKQFAKGIWRCKKISTGEEIEKDDFLNKLKRPNILQSWSEIAKQKYINLKVFGNIYDFYLTPLNKKPTPENVASIYNLPSMYTYPKGTGKVLSQIEQDQVIEKYVMDIRGVEVPFNTDNVCHISEPNIEFVDGNYLIGKSPLVPLSYALSNIKAAYEARNVYITKHGAIGIFSNNTGGNEFGTQDLEDNDKKDLQERVNKYGLKHSQWQFIVTNANVKYQPIAVPKKDLELYNETRESTIAIANELSFPILLFNYLEGSTFSNLDIAHRQLYSDAIIPDAKHITEEINRSVNASDFDKEYWLDYSHIEALQGDKKLEAEKNKINIQTIIELQNSIQSGATNLETAIQILIRVAGYTEQEAISILNEKNENEVE